MNAKKRDPKGVWFRREVQGLTMELYGVPKEATDDSPAVTAEEDARRSLFDYAGNGGRPFLGTLSSTALRDIIETTAFDLRQVESDRLAEIERNMVGSVDVHPVVMGVGNIPERAFADFQEREIPNRLGWFDEALQSLV